MPLRVRACTCLLQSNNPVKANIWKPRNPFNLTATAVPHVNIQWERRKQPFSKHWKAKNRHLNFKSLAGRAQVWDSRKYARKSNDFSTSCFLYFPLSSSSSLSFSRTLPQIHFRQRRLRQWIPDQSAAVGLATGGGGARRKWRNCGGRGQKLIREGERRIEGMGGRTEIHADIPTRFDRGEESGGSGRERESNAM